MELKEYFMPLRRWWWLIVAATAVAVLSSFVATRNQPVYYRASATVMIGGSIENPVPVGSDPYLAEQLANTYVDVVRRKPIRDATMAALGLSFLPAYTSRQVPNTQLVEVAVTDTDPRRAQAVANELVRQLARLSTGTGRGDQPRQAFIAEQLSDIEAGIRETKDEIAKKQSELAGMFSARQIADTQTQIASLQSKQFSLQDNYAALLSNTEQGAYNTVTVIEEADLPEVPVGAGRFSTILLAAAIGFVLATAAAYLLDYLDDTLKNPDDVQKTMNLTTLGAVPMIKSPEGAPGLLVSSDGQSAAAEAFRVLRTNLQFAAVDRPLRTLMITSPEPSEGKSLTASNLAAALAQAGKRVVLVDADLHRPSLHRLFKLRNNAGLTTALIDETPGMDGLLQATQIPGLSVLTTGPLPPNPAELLGSARMRELADALLAQADTVIFDSPPVMALSDTAILSSQVDGVLMVVSAGSTRREMGRRAMQALQRVNARVIGALLNRMPADSSGYYYYYYRYGYHYGATGNDRS